MNSLGTASVRTDSQVEPPPHSFSPMSVLAPSSPMPPLPPPCPYTSCREYPLLFETAAAHAPDWDGTQEVTASPDIPLESPTGRGVLLSPHPALTSSGSLSVPHEPASPIHQSPRAPPAPKLVSSLADEDLPLSNFFSVADLQRAPGSTGIDFSLFCLPTNYSEARSYNPSGGRSLCSPHSGSRDSSPRPLPLYPPAHERGTGRESLPRTAKVRMGYAAEQALCLDRSAAGKLPPGFIPLKINSSLLRHHHLDYKPSWVQPSHFCPGGGQGLFFEVKPGRTLPAGTLIGIYSGRDNTMLRISVKEARARFQSSNYVMTYEPGRYIVDGQNGNVISGPAWCNDNFEMFNCLFSWNPVFKRIELHTKAPLGEGYYEALVNYSDPGKKSGFWTDEKILLLPPESRARCIAYYQGET